MFITAVCLLVLLKLKWPKNKSVFVQFSYILAETVFNNGDSVDKMTPKGHVWRSFFSGTMAIFIPGVSGSLFPTKNLPLSFPQSLILHDCAHHIA